MNTHLPCFLFSALIALSLVQSTSAQAPGKKFTDAGFDNLQPKPAPKIEKLLLKKGDRLAICGDSITEQKMYSRMMETYLTACVPELEVTVRQYGWSGERAYGFFKRMTNDCLRFHPTIATTCYGMNDHEYKPYEERIGQTYSNESIAIVRAFQANGVRVVQGAPGCVGKMPSWVKSAAGTVPDLNLNLYFLRNIGIEIAQQQKAGFADVYWPMYTAGLAAQKQFGTNYAIAGKDGVHPGWAGHAIMAYAFLKALGLDGEIGTFRVDLNSDLLKVSPGHEVVSAKNGQYEIKSRRYPFCATNESLSSDSSIRSGMALVPFHHDLNRLTLVGKGGLAKNYKVTWGGESKTFSGQQLAVGVNLAEAFAVNPFWEAFNKVDQAVKAKQDFETKQMKQIFHGPEGKADIEAAAAKTEAERAPLAAAIKAAFVPVTHTLRLTAE